MSGASRILWFYWIFFLVLNPLGVGRASTILCAESSACCEGKDNGTLLILNL